MGNILAIAGNKTSGKTTVLNYLHGYTMLSKGLIKKFFIDEQGRLVVNAEYQDENNKRFEKMGVFDLNQDNEAFTSYAASTFWPFVKGYNFADPLKSLAIKMFGLTKEQCYGTDDQKNSLTDILWDDIPIVLTEGKFQTFDGSKSNSGPMTAREFMQTFGTDICRKIKEDVWISLCINQIKQDNPDLAIIGDCRFKNEIEAVQKEGGKVIYLTRKEDSSSTHKSEQVSKNKEMCDYIVDNANMSIEEQNEAIVEKLCQWGIIPRTLQ